jgi:hypothetical protein
MTDDELPQDVHTLRPEEREIVPAGVHRATIKKAEERCVEWKKNDANPSGECLSLRLSVGNFQYVFADIPSDKTWLARQLADALGIVAADGTLRIVPGDIEGEEIEVEFKHFTNRQGITKADVKSYVPKVTAPAAPPAKRQTLPQKAAATFRANGGTDDIPFAWLMAAMIAAIGGGA